MRLSDRAIKGGLCGDEGLDKGGVLGSEEAVDGWDVRVAGVG